MSPLLQLARYLDRNYWEQRKEQQASGAPPPSNVPPPSNAPALHVSPQQVHSRLATALALVLP